MVNPWHQKIKECAKEYRQEKANKPKQTTKTAKQKTKKNKRKETTNKTFSSLSERENKTLMDNFKRYKALSSEHSGKRIPRDLYSRIMYARNQVIKFGRKMDANDKIKLKEMLDTYNQ